MHLPNLKNMINSEPNRNREMLMWMATTFISGIVIILSVSPNYLQELHPFTLLLLSIACALPVWTLNQLLWWQIGRIVSHQLVKKLVCLLDISEHHQKEFAFALSKIFSLVDVMRFIPHAHIANIVTVVSIYASVAIVYFISASPAILYVTIASCSLLIWLVSVIIILNVCRKLDPLPMRDVIRELKHDQRLHQRISLYLEQINHYMDNMKGANTTEE